MINDDAKIGMSRTQTAGNLTNQYESLVVHDEKTEDKWLANK